MTINELQTFNDEFLETPEILQSKHLQVYLCGDYNINLLKVYKKDQYKRYILRKFSISRLSTQNKSTNT